MLVVSKIKVVRGFLSACVVLGGALGLYPLKVMADDSYYQQTTVQPFAPSPTPSSPAEILFNKGKALYENGHLREALEVFNDLIRRYWTVQDPGVQKEVVRALVNKGEIFQFVNQKEKALAFFNKVIHQFGEVQDPNVQQAVGQAIKDRQLIITGGNT